LCTLVVEKEVMAPHTYIKLALGVALGGRIRFVSLELANINGPALVNGILSGQALCFEDLDFVTVCLGQLWLSEENAALPHISMPGHGSARAVPAIIDSDALACRIDAYLELNPEPELSRCVFHVLANAFAQPSKNGPLPPEAEF
jgi:hypothetical protein